VQTFTQFTGKCQRIDNQDIAEELYTIHNDIALLSDCQQLCADTCTPSACACKAFEFKVDDSICITFTETERIIGDTAPGYKCMIEQEPFDDNQFTLLSGKCQRSDDLGTTKTEIQGVVFDRDACLALCVNDKECTAA